MPHQSLHKYPTDSLNKHTHHGKHHTAHKVHTRSHVRHDTIHKKAISKPYSDSIKAAKAALNLVTLALVKVPLATINVPIKTLTSLDSQAMERHLLLLAKEDRYLRFGFGVSDAFLKNYVKNLNFDRDYLYGVFNRKLELIAFAHVAKNNERLTINTTKINPPTSYLGDDLDPPSQKKISSDTEPTVIKKVAEFGVSVLPHARGRGYGTKLYAHAEMHARNEGIHQLYIQALNTNKCMLHIAQKAGAVVTSMDDTDTNAYLDLDEPTFDSHAHALVSEHLGEMDFRLKLQAKQYVHYLETFKIFRAVSQSKLFKRKEVPVECHIEMPF